MWSQQLSPLLLLWVLGKTRLVLVWLPEGAGGTSWAQILWLKPAAARLRVSHISQSLGHLALSTKGQHHPSVPPSSPQPSQESWPRALVSPQQGIGGGCAALQDTPGLFLRMHTHPAPSLWWPGRGAGWGREEGTQEGCQALLPCAPHPAARPSEDRLGLCCLWSSMGQSCLVAGCKCRVNFGDTIVISQLI